MGNDAKGSANATNTSSRENAKVSKCNLKQLLGMTSIFVISFVMIFFLDLEKYFLSTFL